MRASCWPSSSPAARPAGRRAADSPSRRIRCRPSRTIPTTCAPVGADTSGPCLRITLEAIDAARAKEGVGPMALPSDFPRLTVPEQLFVAVDRERVDRGLAPFAGLTTALDAERAERAPTRRGCPPDPARRYGSVDHRMDRGRRQRARCGLPVAVQRRPGQRGARVLGAPDLGLLGRPPDRPRSLRLAAPRHGSRLRPDRRHLERGPGRVLAGGDAGHLRPRRAATPTPGSRPWPPCRPGRLQPLRAIPSSESDTGIPRPEPQRGAGARLHARVRAPAGSTIPRPASAPRWTPSTTPTRWRGSAPWCSRRASPG